MDFLTLLNWLFQTAVAFVSTIAFAIIFHTPRREYLCCGTTGGMGWLVYLICMHLGTGVVVASFFATVALAWVLRLLAEGSGNGVPDYGNFSPGAGSWHLLHRLPLLYERQLPGPGQRAGNH